MKKSRVLPLAALVVLASACQGGGPTSPSSFGREAPRLETAPASGDTGTTTNTTSTEQPCPETTPTSTTTTTTTSTTTGGTGTGGETCRGVNMMGSGG